MPRARSGNNVSFGVEFTDEELADPHKAFARLDANGDGRIEMNELGECRVKDAIAFIDRDRDGALVAEELVPMMNMSAGSGRNVMIAVEAGGAGDITDTHVRWTYTRALPYVRIAAALRGPTLHRQGGRRAHMPRSRNGDAALRAHPS